MFKLSKFDEGWFLHNHDLSFYVSHCEVEELFSGVLSVPQFVGNQKREKCLPHTFPLAPVMNQEIWASGVTYQQSATAWQEDSPKSSIYAQVYFSSRPQTFYKGSSAAATGTASYIGIRGDSFQTHPEAELAVIADPNGNPIGYTLGNDVSARDIEVVNPLYQPQSKVFDGSVALGPSIVLSGPDIDPLKWSIELEISRGGSLLFKESFGVCSLTRSIAKILQTQIAYRTMPDGIVVLTGTALTVPDRAMLRHNDVVTLRCLEIGVLESVVRQLDPIVTPM